MPKTSATVATLPLPAKKRGPPPGQKPRPAVKNWLGIEQDYRRGRLTLEAMAALHGVSRQSIIQKAKRAGWERSIAPKVAREVQGQLVDRALKEQRASGVTAEVTAVTALANVTVDVILRHRSGIKDLQEVANGQLAELRAVTIGPDELANVLRLGGDTGVVDPESLKLALKTVEKLCALPSRMGALNQLTGIYERLQAMERQAFGIKGDEAPDEGDQDIKGILVGFVDAPFREVE